MLQNEYYRVTAPKIVWVKTGNVPGNHYFGNSRIYDVVGQKIVLGPGDELHNLVGGLFAITNLGTFQVLHRSPAELNMHFCKDYTPKSWYIEKILSTSCYKVAEMSARKPITYNV
jgi:hypothetical protein